MKRERILAACIVVLTCALGVQVLTLPTREPGERWVASWAHNPKSIAETEKLAAQIVRGRVIAVEPAQDLVVPAPDEPGGVDRIAIEVVTFALEGAYKGATPQTVHVFHTGASIMPDKGPPPAMPQNKMHGNEPIKPGAKANPPMAERVGVSIEDDPPYGIGTHHLLFLKGGPTVNTARAQGIATMTVVAPQGRYAVSADLKLVPVTARGFAQQLRGQAVASVETQLPKFQRLPAPKWHPQLQQLKLQELQRIGNITELNQLQRELNVPVTPTQPQSPGTPTRPPAPGTPRQ